MIEVIVGDVGEGRARRVDRGEKGDRGRSNIEVRLVEDV